MGGNALKNVYTRRYEAEEYRALAQEVVEALRGYFPARRVVEIPAYRKKESFGDLDVLLESDNIFEQGLRAVHALFKPKEVVINGGVISFDYKDFQIDVLQTPSKFFQTSLNYFSYNDLGNLVGRIAHAFGHLKLGHEGLHLPLRDDTHLYATIEVSQNWEEILPFLGYKYSEWENGFDDLEQLFSFVVSTPYFNKRIFLLENRNHASRVRDRKRKTYMGFLKWIEDKNLPEFDYPQNKEELRRKAFEFFPGLKEKVKEAEEKHALIVASHEKFNGTLVASLTGLEGRELGSFMGQFKSAHGGEDFVLWVLKTPNEVLKEAVQSYFSGLPG